jgi:hypothetical protein
VNLHDQARTDEASKQRREWQHINVPTEDSSRATGERDSKRRPCESDATRSRAMLDDIRRKLADFVGPVTREHFHLSMAGQCGQKVTIVLSNAAAPAERIRNQGKPVEPIDSSFRYLSKWPPSFTMLVLSWRSGIPIWSERMSCGSEPCNALRP